MAKEIKDPKKVKKETKEGKGVQKEPEKKRDSEIQRRVRVAGVILDGDKKVTHALRGIGGIGHHVSRSIPSLLDIKGDTLLGDLSDEEISNIEELIKNLEKHLPDWMLNRQKDLATGKDIHLTAIDLKMATMGDLTRQKKLKSYKGVRHSLGLPVRGQRTRTSFRRGTTVGVSRRKDRGK